MMTKEPDVGVRDVPEDETPEDVAPSQFLPKNTARYLAGTIIFEMEYARRRLLNETGTRTRNEHGEQIFFDGHPHELFGQHEQDIVRGAAHLQAQILDKVEHPEDPAYDSIQRQIAVVSHAYGKEILDMAISVARVIEREKSPIPVPMRDTSVSIPTQRLELIIELYHATPITDYGGNRVGYDYTLISEGYSVPPTELPGLHRPLTIALTMEHQRPNINKDASIDITLKKSAKGRRKPFEGEEKERLTQAATLSLDNLLKDRTAQYYVQQQAHQLLSTIKETPPEGSA